MTGKNAFITVVLIGVAACLAADLAPTAGPVAGGPPSAAPAWLLALPETSPASRFDHAMAYDSARGRVVLFGGDSGNGSFGDTWEWNGAAWINKTPAAGPSSRAGHAMAYDSARGRVTMAGAGNGLLVDTWVWDGTAWVEKTPPASPIWRFYNAMAYDSARERLVLFGGVGDLSDLSDTWEWDGSAWVERMPASSPSARYGHAMAYDSARGRVVLFGGFNNETNAYLGDTWEWDGTTWIEATPATAGPSARIWTAMAYDSARRRVVLFGGADATGGLGDTWEWDGRKWVQRSPVTSPASRSEHAMAYDTGRGRIVLFGGYGGAVSRLGDTWEWDGRNWAEKTPATGAPCGGDLDGDGVCDEDDDCPHSILTPSVVLGYGTGSEEGTCDSGVANPLLAFCVPVEKFEPSSCIGGPGCTIADDIELCKSLASDCKEWQRCVDLLAKALEDPSAQSGNPRHAIQKCAHTICK